MSTTIAAIGTALSNSGISIIRISGNDSLNIVNKIFKSKSKLEPNKIVYGKIVNNGDVLDDVLVSYFKAPHSYTGEDICEINCHGGNEITKEILELVLSSGATMAEAGEFSKRAFLNGKMDLSQAEAVINLINAKNRTQTRIAANNLEGNISKKIKELREELVELLAKIEVSVDYPEYDYEEVEPKSIVSLLDRKITEIDDVLKTYDQGKYINNGINVAILGKPNVGKSSLLNNLANYEKAIVTDIPGTTRDIVEETINIGNLTLNISDTAGLRDTDDIIEKIGVEKSLKLLEKMDLVLFVINGKDWNNLEDFDLINKIQKKGLKYIIVVNKVDQIDKACCEAISRETTLHNMYKPVYISATENIGIDELKDRIISIFDSSDLDYNHELIITNERHKNLLEKSSNYLKDAKNEIANGQPIDIVSIYIKKATKSLGEIIGADVTEDVIAKIFEKFCVGK